MNTAYKLRKMIESDEVIVVPGVYDCISAKVAQKAGFDAVFTSGFGISASRLGMPDYGLITASEMLESAKSISSAVSIPVVADMDTGYGNPLNVIRTAEQAVSAGVAGIILEDQQWPKKCGHMEGKKVIACEDHVQKIKAARDASEGSDLVIIARTDSRSEYGIDEAIRRAKEYRDAGADVIFVEAPQSIEELKKVAGELADVPLFANMVEGGKTPVLSADDLKELGYKIVVYPLSGLFSAVNQMISCFDYLKKNRTTIGYENDYSFEDFEQLIELNKFKQLEQKYKS